MILVSMLPHETPQNTEKLEVFIWKIAESQKVKARWEFSSVESKGSKTS